MALQSPSPGNPVVRRLRLPPRKPRGFTRKPAGFTRKPAGFTLVELLFSVAILGLLLIVLSSVTGSASRAWREGQNRTDTFQSARTALELMARELSPAVVDTRTQFVVAPNTILADVVKRDNGTLASQFAPNSPTILWMAPLGNESSLRCVGYYLTRDPARKFYRLKRISIDPPQGNEPSYFPRIFSADESKRSNPQDARWFTDTWDAAAFDDQTSDNPKAVVSSAADGVIAFWVQAYDLLGNPVPLVSKAPKHPVSALYFNSAAYFQEATSTAFEGGSSFVYLASTAQSMKANKVPAAVELTVVTLDSASLTRAAEIPEQTNPAPNGYIDVDAAVAEFEAALKDKHIYTARVFKTRVRLINGN